jgi:tetratricopeptide (TPR) repeat protein
MKLSKIIYYPSYSKSPYRVVKRFSHDHRTLAIIGAVSLAVLLSRAVAKIIEQSLRKRYSSESQILSKAVNLLQSGNVRGASRLINKTLTLYPRSTEAMYLKGVVELEKKNYETASEYFKKSINVDTKAGEYLLGLSVSLFHCGKIHESLVSLKKARELMDKDLFMSYLKENSLTELETLMNSEILEETVYNN